MAKTVVPYTREMKRGNRARDVLAMKRALTRAGALKPPNKPHKITNAFGDRTREALTAFQKKHGYKATGTYTRPVHDRLVRKGHFDAYGAHLMRLAKTAQTKQAPSAPLHPRRRTVAAGQPGAGVEIEHVGVRRLQFVCHGVLPGSGDHSRSQRAKLGVGLDGDVVQKRARGQLGAAG